MSLGVDDITLLSAHFWVKGADEIEISFYEDDGVSPITDVSNKVANSQNVCFKNIPELKC